MSLGIDHIDVGEFYIEVLVDGSQRARENDCVFVRVNLCVYESVCECVCCVFL